MLRCRSFVAGHGIGELKDAMSAFLAGPVTLNSLWDCTGVGEIDISSEDIEDFVAMSERLGAARRGGWPAWVFPTRYGYGLGRMGAILSDLRGVPFQTRIFRGVADAERWLDIG